MLDGMEECEIVAFSTKGVMRFSAERKAMQQAIKYTVDNLKKLKTIIVYSDLSNDSEVFNLFNYASKHKIKIVIPDNLLKHRNTIRTKEKDYGENKK